MLQTGQNSTVSLEVFEQISKEDVPLAVWISLRLSVAGGLLIQFSNRF